MSESVFTVPFERDPRYIDRADITSQLDTQLQSHPRAALAGIGGVGYGEICYPIPGSLTTKRL